jgi:serine/threonine-protein kinase RsbW
VWHNQAIQSEAEFTLSGSLNELETLTDRVAKFCRECSLGEDVEFDLNLVLEELFVNAIRHGGCEGLEEAARVRLQFNGGGVLLEFSDPGTPFDPTGAPAPDFDVAPEDRRAGGLGIHLVRELMRDLRYRREGGRNHLSMQRPVTVEKPEG